MSRNKRFFVNKIIGFYLLRWLTSFSEVIFVNVISGETSKAYLQFISEFNVFTIVITSSSSTIFNITRCRWTNCNI